jgi:hypothetical protein
MALLGEPTPIAIDDPNAAYIYNSQLRDLFAASQNLSLVCHTGAIVHGDKVGNLAAKYLVFTSNGAANTEDAILHKLGHVPNGYIVVRQDKASIVYDSGTAWTTTTIYLKSSAASTAWILIAY